MTDVDQNQRATKNMGKLKKRLEVLEEGRVPTKWRRKQVEIEGVKKHVTRIRSRWWLEVGVQFKGCGRSWTGRNVKNDENCQKVT